MNFDSDAAFAADDTCAQLTLGFAQEPPSAPPSPRFDGESPDEQIKRSGQVIRVDGQLYWLSTCSRSARQKSRVLSYSLRPLG